MTTIVRVEQEKLRTTALPWALLAVSTALTLALALLRAIGSSGGNPSSRLAARPLYTAHGLADVLASPTYAMILAMALGAAATAGEFRHGTAAVTYLAVPARTMVLAAKCCAALPAGALFGIAASAANTAIGLGFVAAHGYHLVMPAVTIIRYGVGDAVGCAILAAIGVAVGTLIRSQVAAVITVFAWAFLIEGALGAISSSIVPYLPSQAAASLAAAMLPGGSPPLPFAAAAAVTVGAAFLLAVAAARVTLPRDIT